MILALFTEYRFLGFWLSLEQGERSSAQANENSNVNLLDGTISPDKYFIYAFLFSITISSVITMATAMVIITIRAAAEASPPAGIRSAREAN